LSLTPNGGDRSNRSQGHVATIEARLKQHFSSVESRMKNNLGSLKTFCNKVISEISLLGTHSREDKRDQFRRLEELQHFALLAWLRKYYLAVSIYTA